MWVYHGERRNAIQAEKGRLYLNHKRKAKFSSKLDSRVQGPRESPPSGFLHPLILLKRGRFTKEHGGSLAVGKRRKVRPLNLKLSHHVTLKSHHAVGPRSLFRHKKLILRLIKKNSFQFHVKVYEYAIQGNHLHLLVKAKTREGLQNFFRVVAGHSAQQILKICPLKAPSKLPGGAPAGAPSGAAKQGPGCKKNQRKFWSYLVYSRIVSWGREFTAVANYIQKNTLELLKILAYETRSKKKKINSS